MIYDEVVLIVSMFCDSQATTFHTASPAINTPSYDHCINVLQYINQDTLTWHVILQFLKGMGRVVLESR